MSNTILHVEDNSDDALLVKMAFKKVGANLDVVSVPDGDEAIQKIAALTQPDLPHCVLLDIKLPGKSGHEILGWIRNNPTTRYLPVIMLSSSLLPEDINRSYALGANSYLIKPPDLPALTELAKAISAYWVRANTPSIPVLPLLA